MNSAFPSPACSINSTAPPPPATNYLTLESAIAAETGVPHPTVTVGATAPPVFLPTCRPVCSAIWSGRGFTRNPAAYHVTNAALNLMARPHRK